MTPEEILRFIEDFLSLFEDHRIDPEESKSKLRLVVDQLALAMWHVPEPELSRFGAVRMSSEACRSIISERFPDLGFYNLVDPEPAGEADLRIGDAIDDLADIYRHLETARFGWNEIGVEESLAYLSATYWGHWHHHLRDLQHYLSAYEKTLS